MILKVQTFLIKLSLHNIIEKPKAKQICPFSLLTQNHKSFYIEILRSSTSSINKSVNNTKIMTLKISQTLMGQFCNWQRKNSVSNKNDLIYSNRRLKS